MRECPWTTRAMDWQPIDLESLQRRIAEGVQAADDDLRCFYDQVACEPAKWTLNPWGDKGGGFWAVAVHEGRVLWFNDIEDGFNVSAFEREGAIPDDQYRCNQDEIHHALRTLRDGGGQRLGPGERIDG